MQFTEQYVKEVNRTSRFAGSVGKDPLCYQFSRQLLSGSFKQQFPLPVNARVLDYGCGKGAVHSRKLADWSSYNAITIFVTPYDIGLNAPAGCKMEGQYDLVILSNILNTQPDAHHVEAVFYAAWQRVKVGGVMVCNYPLKPRKSDVGSGELLRLIQDTTDNYMVAAKDVWIMQKHLVRSYQVKQ